LWYNKPYYGLPTTNQRPDTVLCLKGDNTSDRVYIFDAKYRIYVDNSGIIGPMEDDINVMHRYRDSIVSENKLDEYYKYETFGAYVMFPCSDEKSYKNHKYYKSIDKVNIGAMPMLPGASSLMKKHICNILNESYIEAVNNNPVFDDENDYYKFKNKNVMIVNTKDKNHFDIYKENRFYHIPIKSLSNVKLGVEYLAFYQPKSTFGDDSGIYYFAKIKDFYRYKRSECKEIRCGEAKSNNEYIRFELDEFESIGPILSGDIAPIVVNYTTMYLLKNARHMHELYLKNRKEIEVYKILRYISDSKGIKLKRDKSGFYIGTDKVSVYDKGEIRLNNEVCSLNDLDIIKSK
ncbi:MAG: nuclease domain-containing protein, partial [Peptostreptococcaceae bacterium]